MKKRTGALLVGLGLLTSFGITGCGEEPGVEPPTLPPPENVGAVASAYSLPVGTRALTVDPAGNVYAASASAIYKITPGCSLTMVAGDPYATGYADGAG